MNDYNTVIANFAVFIVIMLRLSGFFVTAPIFSARNIPRSFKIGMIMMLAVIILPAVTAKGIPVLPDDMWGYSYVLLVEFVLGLILGYVASFVFTAIQMTGFFLDTQIGFGVVNILDPLQGRQLPLVGNFLYIISVLVFLILDGHHVLIMALVSSYKIVPITHVIIRTAITDEMINIATSIFILTLKISIPVLASLLLVDLALGILSRFMPQLNIFVVGVPLKIFVGLFILALTLPAYIYFLEVIFNGMYKEVAKVMEFCR